MATSGPRKGKIPFRNLPPFSVFEDGTFGYRVRYRVASEDRNRFSHYSPIYTVKPSFIFERNNSAQETDIFITGRGVYVEAVWQPVKILDRETKTFIANVLEYEVWVKWDKGETSPDPVGVWQFEDVVEGKGEAFTVPSNYTVVDLLGNESVIEQQPNRISIEVYARSTEPSRGNDGLLVYKLDNQTF